MRSTNGEFTETTHSPFKISERIYGFKVNRIIGTPVHEKKSLQSLLWHSRKAGFTSPSDFVLKRKSSPYMFSPEMNK